MCWQPGNSLEEIEKKAIQDAFRYCAENKPRTALVLGISIKTLESKLEQYGRAKEVAPESNAVGPIGPDPSGGLHVESFKKHAEERSLPVREQKEVQKVSSKRSS